MTLVAIPKLADLIADPGNVAFVSLEAVPASRAELAKLDSLLLMRLSFPQGNRGADCSVDGDRLLTVRQAAEMLHTSTDYLYRHASRLPFTVHLGRQLRFSQAGIERYIRQRTGR
jgi:excisionase family DNA binding protein